MEVLLRVAIPYQPWLTGSNFFLGDHAGGRFLGALRNTRRRKTQNFRATMAILQITIDEPKLPAFRLYETWTEKSSS